MKIVTTDKYTRWLLTTSDKCGRWLLALFADPFCWALALGIGVGCFRGYVEQVEQQTAQQRAIESANEWEEKNAAFSSSFSVGDPSFIPFDFDVVPIEGNEAFFNST